MKEADMCTRATCPKCGKVTWTGCGRHVDAVMAGVPPERRCTCPGSTAPARSGGWFSRSRRGTRA